MQQAAPLPDRQRTRVCKILRSDRADLVRTDGLAVGLTYIVSLGPVLPAVARYIHRQFQAAPNTDFGEGAAEVVLDDLLGGAGDFADFAIGQPFPDQDRNLNFFGGEALAGVMIALLPC